MNELPEGVAKGTVGELLVQLRLLLLGVQAAPPLKDSGNDLIAIRRQHFRAIQVKTRTWVDGRVDIGTIEVDYHILALVLIDPQATGVPFQLDRCRVFLVPRERVNGRYLSLDALHEWELSPSTIERLFTAVPATQPNYRMQATAGGLRDARSSRRTRARRT